MSHRGECDCCQFETDVSEYPNSNLRKPGTKQLCDLCAGTMIGTFDEYRDQHDRDALDVMKTICYVGNAILQALKSAGGDPQ